MTLDQLLKLSKITALVTACFLFVSLAILAGKAGQASEDADATFVRLSSAADNLNLALAKVNQPKTGTLAEADKLMLAGKSTLTHVDIAVAHEDRNLTVMDDQERALYSDIHTTLKDGQDVLKQGARVLNSANDSVRAIQPPLLAVTSAADSVNKLVTDPSIPKTLVAVQRGSEASADTAVAVRGTAQDVQVAVHNYLHPKWYFSVANWGLKVLHAITPF